MTLWKRCTFNVCTAPPVACGGNAHTPFTTFCPRLLRNAAESVRTRRDIRVAVLASTATTVLHSICCPANAASVTLVHNGTRRPEGRMNGAQSWRSCRHCPDRTRRHTESSGGETHAALAGRGRPGPSGAVSSPTPSSSTLAPPHHCSGSASPNTVHPATPDATKLQPLTHTVAATDPIRRSASTNRVTITALHTTRATQYSARTGSWVESLLNAS